MRDAEKIARKIAFNRVRKKEYLVDPIIVEMEEELGEKLGTRVQIEMKENGGHIKIDFFSNDDLQTILGLIKKSENIKSSTHMLENHIASNANLVPNIVELEQESPEELALREEELRLAAEENKRQAEEATLYDISNFSI